MDEHLWLPSLFSPELFEQDRFNLPVWLLHCRRLLILSRGKALQFLQKCCVRLISLLADSSRSHVLIKPNGSNTSRGNYVCRTNRQSEGRRVSLQIVDIHSHFVCAPC